MSERIVPIHFQGRRRRARTSVRVRDKAIWVLPVRVACTVSMSVIGSPTSSDDAEKQDGAQRSLLAEHDVSRVAAMGCHVHIGRGVPGGRDLRREVFKSYARYSGSNPGGR